MRRAIIQECILWAKDRLIDDFNFGFLNDDEKEINYAAMSADDRDKYRVVLDAFNQLMQLPEDSVDSLDKLQKAGYWNGSEDTYFEEDVLPPLEMLN